MASKYGQQMLSWLLARGWKLDPTPHPPGWAGDPAVIDPSGKITSLPDALKVQQQKTGEKPPFLDATGVIQ